MFSYRKGKNSIIRRVISLINQSSVTMREQTTFSPFGLDKNTSFNMLPKSDGESAHTATINLHPITNPPKRPYDSIVRVCRPPSLLKHQSGTRNA